VDAAATELAKLRARNAELERRVIALTAQSEVAVSNLHAQMSQRAQAEIALRESEERYRRLVELSPEAIVVVADDEIVYVNAAGVRLFAAGSTAALLATRPFDLVRDDDRAQIAAEVRSLSRAAAVTQARLIRLDGRPLDAELTAASVTFDGRPAVQMLIRDVSDRRAVERMKDELLSVLSHELRTPLTSIRGSLGLLDGGVLGPLSTRGQRMIGIAVRNTDRLIRLLNDVLDVERMQAGRLVLEPRLCPVAELIELAVAEMRGLAERSGVQLLVGSVEGVVEADADRLVQVLTNLLSNAIKFSTAGGQVRLSAVVHGQQVRFSVADQGRGIPADKLEFIFERFHQVDASDARVKGGTGLGLAICKSIVDQHGGQVWAESRLGHGSTFYVELRGSQKSDIRSQTVRTSASVSDSAVLASNLFALTSDF
jgi:PAS domain S-box-containing protein